MTPLPNVPRPSNEDQTYSTAATAPDSSTLSPPLQRPGGRNNLAQNSHKKKASVTSNPVQGSEDSLAHQQFQVLSPAHGDLAQSHAAAPDYMSSTSPLEHEFGADAHHSLSFDDLMTPEYSDNHISEHTTPQELIWEQQFLPSDSDQPHIFQASDFGSPQNPQSPSNDFKGVFAGIDQDRPNFVSGSQLLSPQLTTPSPPNPAPHQRTFTQSQIDAASSLMGPSSRKRAAEPLQLSTAPSTLTPQRNGNSPNQRPVSPVVIVSSHPRGDSPARPTFSRARSLSKRGRESSLHESSDHEDASSASRSPRLSTGENSASRLMPPDQFDPEKYQDDNKERSGVDPSQRGMEQVATINELADQRKIDEKNAEVEDWLAKSETGSVAGEARSPSRRSWGRPDRPRAHSTGIPVDAMGLPIYSDRNIPGPGVLVDEDSQDEYSENGSASVAESEGSAVVPDSPPVSAEELKEPKIGHSYFTSFEDEAVHPELQEPLPRQFYRRTPWQDPTRGAVVSDARDQPNSSNAAAMRFNQEAAKWESASRAATWGTRRRLSESEVNSIVDGSRVRHLSLAKRGRERGNSILSKARGLIPRRSNSNIKKGSESPPKCTTPDSEGPIRRDTGGSIKPVSRIPSFGKPKPPKSPPLDTSMAFMAMTSNLTAVGQGSSSAIEPSSQKPEGLRSPLQMLRKVRSKSDVGKSPSKSGPGLAELIARQGGPPMPTLASPAQNPHHGLVERPSALGGAMDDDDDDDDDDPMDEVGIKMDLKVRAENIIPNYEGFKIHARQLNPRLDPSLIDRVGQEQVRRYKKLMDNKIKHTRAVQVAQKCSSGKHCFALGGDATLLPPRVSSRDPETTCAQFQITNPAEEEVDETSFEEGVVTPALFPPGIPLPPVKRLPAEFECTLCFKVKKFQKPSDWTKHVHEDIQPFSCTFPNCNEPKSFKRKADWVRHENERHRRLEYWKCHVQECSHVCYRKDNFVQHLVREHKKTEPKVKSRGSGSSKAKPPQGNGWQTNSQEDNEVWRLVEQCRFETSSKPRDEPCRFCGNICSSWKKLSVHMGKHMEQIAMPVLELVSMKEVAPDTVISPIEQNLQPQTTAAAASAVPTIANHVDHHPSLSPYAVSASSYQNSSAGHSPAAMHAHAAYGYGQGFYGTHGMSNATQGPLMQSEAYANTSVYPASANYATGPMPVSNQFGSINTQLGSPYSSAHAVQTPASGHSMHANIPRSQPMGNGYQGNSVATSGGASYNSQPVAYGSSPDMRPYHQYASTTSQSHNFSNTSEHIDSNQHYDMGPHASGSEYMYNVQRAGNNGHAFQYS